MFWLWPLWSRFPGPCCECGPFLCCRRWCVAEGEPGLLLAGRPASLFSCGLGFSPDLTPASYTPALSLFLI